MNINSLFPNQTTQRTVQRTDKTKSSGFQQALTTCASAQPTMDTFTPSYKLPSVEITDSASATKIMPGDSTQVKLDKLRKIAEETDYTGMDYNEIYSAIWNRYNDAFDGNLAAITTFPQSREWVDVCNQFFEETLHDVQFSMISKYETDTGIRGICYWNSGSDEDEAYFDFVRTKYGNFYANALGYKGMSIEETERAIYEKYAGKNTLRDFLNMQGELYHSGVLKDKMGVDGANAFIRAINSQLPETYFPDLYLKQLMQRQSLNIPQSMWDAALDGKFDARAFAADMRETLKRMTFNGWDFDIEGAISKGIDSLLDAVDRCEKE